MEELSAFSMYANEKPMEQYKSRSKLQKKIFKEKSFRKAKSTQPLPQTFSPKIIKSVKKRKLQIEANNTPDKKNKLMSNDRDAIDFKVACEEILVNEESTKKRKKKKDKSKKRDVLANVVSSSPLNSSVEFLKNIKTGKNMQNGTNKIKTSKKALNISPIVNGDSKPPKKGKRTERDSSDEEIPQLVELSPMFKDQDNISASVHKLLNADDRFEDGEKLLQWLLQPISIKEFFDKYWEKKPIYVKHKNEECFKMLFSSEALDSMVRQNALYYNTNVDVVIYRDGKRETEDLEGRAFPSMLWDFYNDGYSIRIKDPHSYDKKLKIFLTTLQEYFGSFVGSNVYLTPAGSQGFAPHYDDIEAFIIQVEGRKHWKLYLPPEQSDELARFSSPNYPRDKLTAPFAEITLVAGDVLYFPRGVVHEAHTDADSHSLHITVSTYQKTAYIDLLESLVPMALRNAAAQDVEYRRGLPMHHLRHLGGVNRDLKTPIRQKVLTKVEELLSNLGKYAPIDDAVDDLGRRFMWESLAPVAFPGEKHRMSINDGDMLFNGKVINKAELAPDTEVRLFRYHCIRLVLEATSAKIYYNVCNKGFKELEEQFLEIELNEVPIIQSLQRSYPSYVAVDKLSKVDLVTKVKVIFVLWQFGLIVTKEPLEIDDDDDVEEYDEVEINSGDEEVSTDDESVVVQK